MLEVESNSRTTLYSIFHEYGDKAVQSKRTKPVVVGSFDLKALSPQILEVASSSKRKNDVNIAKPSKPSKADGNSNRHALPGTGRLAFGPTQELREIYQVHSAHHNQKNTNHHQLQERIDFEDISLEKLSLHPVETLSSSSTHSNIRNAEHIQQPMENNLPNKKTKTIDDQEIPPVPPAASTNIVPPKPATGTAKQTAPLQQKQQFGTQTKGPISTGPKSANTTMKSVRSTGNPYLKPTSAGGANPAAPTTGLPTGHAAARARMAALGEEWAEEEELPGMKFGAPSSALLRNGQVNSSVMKETNKATQRQQKLIVAKKK